MTEKLERKCQAEKANDIEDLCKWMLEVKRIDDSHHAKWLEFEEIARTTHNKACKSNALSEPSCCANTNNGGSSRYHTLHTAINFTALKIYENSLCKWEECKRIWGPCIFYAKSQI
jgi:hypothetical protein